MMLLQDVKNLNVLYNLMNSSSLTPSTATSPDEGTKITAAAGVNRQLMVPKPFEGTP